MQILPAVDILDESVVRLLRGDYDIVTRYDDSPERVLEDWGKAGAEIVHVVDLDGARTGEPNVDLVRRLSAIGVPFQVGGGIRSVATAAEILKAGASRVVLGSKAVWDPSILHELVAVFGAERIVAAVDVKDGKATGTGWLDEGQPVETVLSNVAAAGVGWILATGIATDGTMAGPDMDLIRQALAAAPGIGIIASGGVGSVEDLVGLQASGAEAAIVGKALYEKRFTFAEARAAVAG